MDFGVTVGTVQQQRPKSRVRGDTSLNSLDTPANYESYYYSISLNEIIIIFDGCRWFVGY